MKCLLCSVHCVFGQCVKYLSGCFLSSYKALNDKVIEQLLQLVDGRNKWGLKVLQYREGIVMVFHIPFFNSGFSYYTTLSP